MKKIKKSKVKHLYESYGSVSDLELKRYLKNTKIFVKCSSFESTMKKEISPYRMVDATLMKKIKKKLRKEIFLWNVHKHLTEEMLNLEQNRLKKIDFLVKSRNNTKTLLDIGQIFDAIPLHQRDRVSIIAIDIDQSVTFLIKGTKMLHVIAHASYMLTPE